MLRLVLLVREYLEVHQIRANQVGQADQVLLECPQSLQPHFFQQDLEVLEDQRARPEELLSTLVGVGQRTVVDLMVLAHGTHEGAVGWKGACLDQEFLDELQAVRNRHGLPVQLRCVYTIACHSAQQANGWLAAGAQVVNGVLGENWLPVPTLPLFVARWRKGATFGEAALAAHTRSLSWARALAGRDWMWQDRIEASRQMVAGRRDVRLAESLPRSLL